MCIVVLQSMSLYENYMFMLEIKIYILFRGNIFFPCMDPELQFEGKI